MNTHTTTHLTRRGRVVLVLLLAAVLLAVFSVGRSSGEVATAADVDPGTVQVVVQSGDTLWGVAQEMSPEADPREVIEQIRQLNDLSSGLQAGQVLVLPA